MNIYNVVICLFICFSYRNGFVQSRYTNGSAISNGTNNFTKFPKSISDLSNYEDYVPNSELYHVQNYKSRVLDIKNHNSTDQIDYYFNPATNTHIFTPKYSNSIERVTNGYRVIWDSDHNEHADKVDVKYNEEGEPIVRIHSFGGGHPKEFVNRLIDAKIKNNINNNHVKYEQSTTAPYQILHIPESNDFDNVFVTPNFKKRHSLGLVLPKSKEAEPNKEVIEAINSTYIRKVTLVEIDIQSESNTDEFLVFKNEKISTYYPRDNYGFNLVREGNDTIWEAIDPEEYVYAIGIDNINSNDKTVTIHLNNGITKVFVKKKNKNWTEGSPNVELDISKKGSCYGFDYSDDEGVATYTTKNGYSFKCVKNGNNKIWECDNDNECASEVIRDGVGLLKSLNNITIVISNKYKHYSKSGGKWSEKSSDIDLDLSSKESKFEYKYKKVDKYNSFTPQNGYKFKIVKDNSTIIWDVENDKYNQIKSIAKDGIGLMSKLTTLTIFFENGNFRVFNKSDNKWIREPEIKFYSKNHNIELEKKMYDIQKNGEDIFYNFKYGSKCTKICYFHKMVDSIDPSIVNSRVITIFEQNAAKNAEYPKSLSYSWQNKIVVNFNNYSITYEKDTFGNWNHLDYDIQLFGLECNSNNNSNNTLLDHKMYDLKRMGNGRYDYDIKNNIKCFMVKIGDKIVWKHGQHGYEYYPRTVSYRNKNKIVIDFGENFIVCEKDLGGNWENKQIYLKLYAENLDDNTLKLDTDQCSLEKTGDCLLYTIYDNFRCVKVRYVEKILYPDSPKNEATNEQTVWIYNPSKNEGKYPRSILLQNGDKITLHFQGSTITYEKDGYNKWNQVDKVEVYYSIFKRRNPLIIVFTTRDGKKRYYYYKRLCNNQYVYHSLPNEHFKEVDLKDELVKENNRVNKTLIFKLEMGNNINIKQIPESVEDQLTIGRGDKFKKVDKMVLYDLTISTHWKYSYYTGSPRSIQVNVSSQVQYDKLSKRFNKFKHNLQYTESNYKNSDYNITVYDKDALFYRYILKYHGPQPKVTSIEIYFRSNDPGNTHPLVIDDLITRLLEQHDLTSKKNNGDKLVVLLDAKPINDRSSNTYPKTGPNKDKITLSKSTYQNHFNKIEHKIDSKLSVFSFYLCYKNDSLFVASLGRFGNLTGTEVYYNRYYGETPIIIVLKCKTGDRLYKYSDLDKDFRVSNKEKKFYSLEEIHDLELYTKLKNINDGVNKNLLYLIEHKKSYCYRIEVTNEGDKLNEGFAKYTHKPENDYTINTATVTYKGNELYEKKVDKVEPIEELKNQRLLCIDVFFGTKDETIPLLIKINKLDGKCAYYSHNKDDGSYWQRITDEQFSESNTDVFNKKLKEIQSNLFESICIVASRQTKYTKEDISEKTISKLSDSQPKEIDVTPNSDIIWLKNKSYKCYEHKLGASADYGPEQSFNDNVKLRLFIETTKNKYSEICLYNNDDLSEFNREYIYYKDEKKGDNGTGKFSVIFKCENDRNKGDPRPLLLCYKDKIYKPSSLKDYGNKWVYVQGVKLESNTSENPQLLATLEKVCYFLNPVDVGQLLGIKTYATNKYETYKFNDNKIEVNIRPEDLNCYKKYTHTPTEGYVLGEIFHNGSKLFDNYEEYLKSISKNGTFPYDIIVYYYMYDKGHNYPLLLCLRYSGIRPNYFKLTSKNKPLKWELISDSYDLSLTNNSKIETLLYNIRYALGIQFEKKRENLIMRSADKCNERSNVGVIVGVISTIALVAGGIAGAFYKFPEFFHSIYSRIS
ncbi:hypothetical protein MACK_003907 [Theileria orientalis]|uniref:Uncharacterized protein n=1 Tax=Theileria orientalis TaxID=68886 RepID=A0A976SJ30_THEOR|nr:hypothetical protein MACK_003907 [Theileria orientalis]